MIPEEGAPSAPGAARRPSDDDELILPEARAEARDAPPPAAEADANADALPVSDGLRSRIRAMERAGCAQPFGERIALIGAAELDGKRPVAQRSGAYKLLSAVYERGRPHWSDPVRAISPLRELLFKEEAPPNADRGLFYLLARAAQAGISPSAFAIHLILPRMGRDADWRRWRSRHIWVLDGVLDLLIGLRAQAPWDAERLAGGAALADVALCKYVGRPLCRLSGSLIENQGPLLEAWAESWKGMRLGSIRFIRYLRSAVLPSFYRLSGKIDPEQLAPMGRSLLQLERVLAPRLDAMDERSFESLLASGGFASSLEPRAALRASGQAPFFDLVRELRAYLEAALALAGHDAGPALLAYLDKASLRRDAGFMADAATALAALPPGEGGAVLRWHIGALAATDLGDRERFIMELRGAGDAHPSCPWRRPASRAARFAFEPKALIARLNGTAGRPAPSLAPTVDFARLRPAHADAIRAAKAPLALEALCAALAELAALKPGDGDPQAARAYAELGKEWARLRAADRDETADRDGAVGGPQPPRTGGDRGLEALDAAFALVEDLPSKAGSALRVGAAALAAWLALPPGPEPGLSLLGSALSQLRAEDAYPRGIETLLKAIRADYVPGFLGLGCASLALQCAERIASLWAEGPLREELSELRPEAWGTLLGLARGEGKAAWAAARDALRACLGYGRLREELVALRDLAAKNLDAARAGTPPKAFLRAPIVKSSELYPAEPRFGGPAPGPAIELIAGGDEPIALAQLDEFGDESLRLRISRLDPEFALAAGSRDLARCYQAIRASAASAAAQAGRRLVIDSEPRDFSADEILGKLALRYERGAGGKPTTIESKSMLLLVDAPHPLRSA